MATSSKKELIDQVMRLQMQIQRQMRDDAPDAWLALDLTIGQLKSLFFINFEGVTNLKHLAAALGTTPPNVTGIIDRLVEHNLVSRECNQLNRREQILKLTSTGRELMAELKERATSQHTRMLEQLEIADLAALVQGLTALARAAQQDPEIDTSKRLKRGFPTGLPAV
jgi:DNA-binding MarR family transcriptional regulator